MLNMDNDTQTAAVTLLAEQIAEELSHVAARVIAERLSAVAVAEDDEDQNAFQPAPTIH